MDPTLCRPWDGRPVLDDNTCPQDDNLCYERIFAARICNLFRARQNIYKQALLEELYRMRQVVVSATDTAKGPPQSYTNRSPNIVPIDRLSEGPSRSTTENQDFPQRHDSDFNSLPASEAQSCESANAYRGGSLVGEPFPAPQPHTEQEIIPWKQAENPLSASNFRSASASASFLEINVKRFPALTSVVSAYRYFGEMNNTYYSTMSPFFLTLSVKESSAIEQRDQIDNTLQLTNVNRTRNLHSNSQPLDRSPEPVPTFPNFRIPPFPERFLAPFHRRRYIPPLLARLFFERELALLFDSQLRYTYSAERVSLAKASDLYAQELFPVSRTYVPHIASGSFESFEEKSPQPSARNTTIGRDLSEETSSTSPSAELCLPHGSTFQLRTFYRSMTRTAELVAPFATWREDKLHADVSILRPPSVESYHAYSVSSDVRRLSSYINLQGVLSGQSNASVTLAFGFQRRTNYPFRRTYSQPRTAETISVQPKIAPRVSREFASRVPVTGLSSTLLHLFQPEVYGGLFFSNAQEEESLGLESMSTDTLYSINTEGKLV